VSVSTTQSRSEQVPRPQRPARSDDGFRPDVQGLRAVAVGLVVLYHLYPSVVPGGYVGVDVFFVISGYLITAHLARARERTGRVRLLDFYGRRARRLLPAAALVLTVTWLLSRLWLPSTQLPATADQVRASALYFQNWTLAHDAVSYLAQGQAATPVEHFWSLSVEEQFYLGWPLLFLIAGAVAAVVTRRRPAARRVVRPGGTHRIVLLALAAAVVAISLGYSILETRRNPAAAYFVTPTRIWELGIGGVLSLLPGRLVQRMSRLGALAWIGLVAIVVAALRMSGSTAFPGWVALFPVLGAALVLVCGSRAAVAGPSRLLASRPFVFVGDISYSLYLWHWPMIVLWLAYSGGSIGYLDGLAIIVASVLLSWATKILVEDRFRRARIIVRHPAVSLATALTVIVPVALVTIFIASEPASWNGKLDGQHPGAAALAPHPTSAAAPPSVGPADYVPPLAEVTQDIPLLNHNGCEVGTYSSAAKPCTFYSPANPTLTVALVGDSHAAQWSSALLDIAQRHRWKLVGEVHAACRWTATMTVLAGKPYTACHEWGVQVLADLVNTVKPGVVIITDRAVSATVDHPTLDATSRTAVGEGMAPYVTELLRHGIKVVAIHETPELGRNVPDCLSGRRGSIAACSTSARKALWRHTSIDGAAAKLGSRLPVVDMNDYLCTSRTCLPVVGNVVVYRDTQHLTRTITLSLAPYLDERLHATGAFTADG
jgi:peptidoglycan/LPS O-acetylase OafA/YrhL